MKPYQNRLQSIDALRGLAALVIVLYHARAMFWVGLAETWKQYGLSLNLNAWLGYATAPLYFGGLGVPLFFVLSGYCIHRHPAQRLATNSDTKLNIKAFFIRRFWRIYPTYFVALCLTALVDAYIKVYHPAQVPSEQDNSVLAFCMSLLSLQGFLTPNFGSNSVFWTLSIEIHLYLVYPLLHKISRLFNPLKVLILTLVVSLTYSLLNQHLEISNYFPYRGSGGPLFFPYWFTWTIGFYIAEIEAGRAFVLKKNKLIFLTTLSSIITILFVIFNTEILLPISTALAFGGILYWSIKIPKHQFVNILLGKWLAKIGIFSYSLYAIHRPFLALIKASVPWREKLLFTLIPTLFTTLMSVLLAWLIFNIIERWTLKPSAKN